MKVSQTGTSALSAVVRALVEGSSQAPPSSGYGYRLNVLNNRFGRYLSGTQPANTAVYSASELTELRNAVRTAYRNKATIVCARGNNNVSTPTYPASFRDEWVLSVGASDETGNRASFSNFGDNVDLMAPGVDPLVLTTQSRQTGSGSAAGLYTSFNGTSAAAPHVSGVAALLLSNLNSTTSLQNNLAPEDVEELLQRTATDKGTISPSAPYDAQTGWGLLNAGQALYKSRPGPYRVIHDRLTTSASTVATNVNIQLFSAYASGAATLAAGTYVADRYRVTGTFSPRASLVTANEQILGVWARNSSTNLWSAANPLEAEAGVRVVSWNQNAVEMEGYAYYIKYTVTGQAVNRWVPYNPITTSQGIMDVTYYTYNSGLEFPDPPCFRAEPDPTDPFPSTSAAASAYPNPATESVTIGYSLTVDVPGVQLQLLNGNGQVVRQQELPAQKAGPHHTSVALREMADGFYMFRLVSEDGVQAGKFVKQ